jgi:hypothetical protein
VSHQNGPFAACGRCGKFSDLIHFGQCLSCESEHGRPLSSYPPIFLAGSTRFAAWSDAWCEALAAVGRAAFPVRRTSPDVRDRALAASHAVLVLNPFAYLGDGALSDVRAAEGFGKRVMFAESWGEGMGIGLNHRAEVIEAAARAGTPLRGSRIATSQYRGPWEGDLLGQAGEARSRAVEIIYVLKREYEGGGY